MRLECMRGVVELVSVVRVDIEAGYAVLAEGGRGGGDNLLWLVTRSSRRSRGGESKQVRRGENGR